MTPAACDHDLSPSHLPVSSLAVTPSISRPADRLREPIHAPPLEPIPTGGPARNHIVQAWSRETVPDRPSIETAIRRGFVVELADFCLAYESRLSRKAATACREPTACISRDRCGVFAYQIGMYALPCLWAPYRLRSLSILSRLREFGLAEHQRYEAYPVFVDHSPRAQLACELICQI